MTKINQKIIGYKVVKSENTTQAVETILDASDEVILSLHQNPEQEATKVKEIISKAIKKVELKRPLCLEGKEWRLKPSYAEHALYVRINAIEYEGKKYPYEIFFNTKETNHEDELRGYPLLLSVWFKEAIIHGLSLSPIIENLKACSSTKGGYLSKVPNKPKFVKGLLAEIGYVIEEFNNECLNYTTTHEEEFDVSISTGKQELETQLEFIEEIKQITNPCPECSEQLELMDGCLTCLSCGYSKCS